MRTIETTATITNDWKLTVSVSPDIVPREHRIVLVIEEKTSAAMDNVICFSALITTVPSEASAS